jgi:hypothetical protein
LSVLPCGGPGKLLNATNAISASIPRIHSTDNKNELTSLALKGLRVIRNIHSLLSLGDNWPTRESVKFDAPGRRSHEDANKVLGMIAAQDFEAMSKFLALRGSTGDCVILNGGQELYVQKHAANDGVCVRPKGGVDCYWVKEGWMKPWRPVKGNQLLERAHQ